MSDQHAIYFAFIAGVGLLCLILSVQAWVESRRHRRQEKTGTSNVPPENGIKLPPLPDAPVVADLDGRPIAPETLGAVAALLHVTAHAWMAQAYDEVLAQIAADEATRGAAEVEDAANKRRSS